MSNILKTENLGKEYPLPKGTLSVFEKLNFELERGRIVAIMGVSGVGKTTFLNLIAGLDSPTSGNVFVEGENLDWGYVQWIRKRRLVNLIMDGAVGVADYQCRQILGDNRYYRLNPLFPGGQSFPLDAVKEEEIQALIDFAEGVPLQETIAWIKANWLTDETSLSED